MNSILQYIIKYNTHRNKVMYGKIWRKGKNYQMKGQMKKEKKEKIRSKN